MRAPLPLLFGLAVALTIVAGASTVEAMPRFALRQGAHCTACHIDPTGGGMRNDYGRIVYAVSELPLTAAALPLDALPFDAKVGDTLAFGSDLRVLYHFLDNPHALEPRANSFYVMEASLYAAADLWGWTTLYLAPSFHGSESFFFEASGIFHLPWLDAYAKVGRFIPPYGYKLANHSTFIRKQLGFNVRSKEVGAELGLYPGPFSIQLAAFNGVPERADSDWDDNGAKGLSTRISAMIDTRWLKLELGGSGFYNIGGNPAEKDPSGEDTRIEELRTGVFGGLALGRFTYLAEADYRRQDDRLAQGPVGQLFSYQELAFLAVQGLEVLLTYELLDTDVKAKGDAVHRFGGGFELYGVPLTELAVTYRYALADARHPMSDLHELMGVAHVFF